MKTIEVVAAIIEHEGRILATQRGYGDFKDGWEFPGGKMEPGETPEAAIVREIEEELKVTIAPKTLVTTVECDYPKFHLTMHCFLSSIVKGEICLVEHEAAKWLSPDELDSVDWLPADVEVVEKLSTADAPREHSSQKSASGRGTFSLRSSTIRREPVICDCLNSSSGSALLRAPRSSMLRAARR